MRIIVVLTLCLAFCNCNAQDTTKFQTTGLQIYRYDKTKIFKDFSLLKRRLRKEHKGHFNLGNDLLLTNDNFFILGSEKFTINHVVNEKRSWDSLFIWHVSDYYELVYLLEKEMKLKFPIFSDIPCISVPYISLRGMPKAAFKIFFVNCSFIEVNLFIENEQICNRLNTACGLLNFYVGKSYKIFILQEIVTISSYLDKIKSDKSLKVLKIPTL